MGSSQSVFDETSTELPSPSVDTEDIVSSSISTVNETLKDTSWYSSLFYSLSATGSILSDYDVLYLQTIFIALFYYISIVVTISLVLASLGISVGFRRLYIILLLYIFEVRFWTFFCKNVGDFLREKDKKNLVFIFFVMDVFFVKKFSSVYI